MAYPAIIPATPRSGHALPVLATPSAAARTTTLLVLSDDKDQSCEAGDDIASRHLAEIDQKIDDLTI